MGSAIAIAIHVRRRRPRLHSALYIGVKRYFLTFCTAKRQCCFSDSVTVESTLEQILHVAGVSSIEIVAYCFMPDHLHLLIEGLTDCADMIAFVHQAKQRSGYEFSRRTGKRLWQPSYHDRILRDDDSTIAVVRYIVENPIRAGLVASPTDYRFLGSSRFSMDAVLEAVAWDPERVDRA